MIALPASDAADQRLTPMMAQYIEIKAANPDCLLFYRMGDFYELFFADAEEASRALGIVLTKRGKHLGEDIPMCGVPIERAPDYLQRLIALGHRVAVCEQIEDPAEARKRGGKSVVRRAVTRLVTPGTITEEALLEPGRSALLVALARAPSSEGGFAYGLAAVDLSTGRFTVAETSESALAADLARLEPRELLVPDAILEEPALKPLWRDWPGLTPLAREGLDPVSAEQRLASFYGVRSLAGFGAFSRAELVAGGAVLAYVERTQIGARPALSPPWREPADNRMQIDPATRANLELTRTLAGERAGSLLAALDRSVTPAGARLLAERLAGPLTDPAAIARRLDAVERLTQEPDLRKTLRHKLKAAPDFARALSRLALERGGPRDLAALRDGLAQALAVGALLTAQSALPEELADAARMLLPLDAGLAEALAAVLAPDLPLNRRDGGFVRAGHDSALDEARALRDESRQVIAALQARYAQETGARNLRVKHNNFLGYFVEAPQAVGETLLQPPHNGVFIHRQTMQGAMRFSTAELSELESRIASAAERALALELAIFDALAARALEQAGAIRDGADALAVIDVAAALAERAEEDGWTRPLVDGSLAFTLEGARHPVVEAALKREGQPFIANDTELSPPEPGQGARIALITGPNMAGKSTYLRQNALIAALAQMGSFVPARRAHIGAVDRLFSRVGAADDLARGRSTFMVEMIETAAILHQAGPRALVILDEIGRGTATYDGLSIAWATIEHLHGDNRCRTLFATHFHELTALAKRLPRLVTATMRVAEWKGEVVFLHEVTPGVADRSYGIQVAKLAGLPASVVARARVILDELESLDRKAPVTALVDDLPLFAARPAPVAATVPDPLREALAALALDDLSPREALEELYRLKGLARN